MSTGSTRRVSKGRAQIWLGEVDAAYSDQGRLVPAAEFEFECQGKILKGWAIKRRPSEEICGCRVRLLEDLGTSPPSVRLEVSWTKEFDPDLQAASEALRPPGNRPARKSPPAQKKQSGAP